MQTDAWQNLAQHVHTPNQFDSGIRSRLEHLARLVEQALQDLDVASPDSALVPQHTWQQLSRLANCPLTRTLSGDVTATYCRVSVSYNCFTWVLTMYATRVKLPATKRRASITCPLAMVRVFAPRLASRCQVGLAGQEAAHSADGVLHTPFLPGGADIAEEGLDAQGMELVMPRELGAVVECDTLAPLGREGGQDGSHCLGDGVSGLAWGAGR